LTKNSLFFT